MPRRASVFDRCFRCRSGDVAVLCRTLDVPSFHTTELALQGVSRNQVLQTHSTSRRHRRRRARSRKLAVPPRSSQAVEARRRALRGLGRRGTARDGRDPSIGLSCRSVGRAAPLNSAPPVGPQHPRSSAQVDARRRAAHEPVAMAAAALPVAGGLPTVLDASTSDDQTSITWHDPLYPYALNRYTVMHYFEFSPFFDRTSNNMIARRQNLDPAVPGVLECVERHALGGCAATGCMTCMHAIAVPCMP
eukprot:365580-Chlamydomonas_euryale.AAC.5